MNSELKQIYAKLKSESLDGLLISQAANITYLVKYLSRDSYFLASPKSNVYITDSRYFLEAKKALKNTAYIKKTNGSVFKLIAATLKELGLNRVGFEERHLPFGEYQKIKEEVKRPLELVPTHSLVEDFRKIKSQPEIKKIKRAIQITTLAFKFIEKIICVGKREIEIAAELERFIRYNGASGSAFNIIVASGANSSFPHHITSQRKLANNEPVLVDLGVEYLGYKSDLTRVFFLGKMTSIFKRIYDIVLKAQEQAIAAIKPGVSIKRVDVAARQYIAQKGFGRFFGHGLGHSIGLEVHEEPHISSKNNQRLTKGMVFTVEPAIYLPGKFGIRIEDMVLVREGGVRVLSGEIHKLT